ncbi:CapA family protein [Jiangella mangrovi]|uniref:Poly-gamma-glutamate synthesis protein (Capsule biosynthesis protein) n=1 Tax=Jiangella mangrovi TaxID=1524084 RepID=A0A7W9LN87_9ACTN|nr:CapA family protein [Jiangella mangrovi]MBB5789897.1 poly-gamma-glutamate synthesis protein (capsule biosynthesis protein) [Jiangella mangrovi]
MNRRLARLAAATTVAGLLALTACGSDDGDSSGAAPPSSPGTPTTSPSPTPTPTPTPDPRTFTLVATGDVLLHERLWTQARNDAGPGEEMDFAPQLANIAPIVEGADLAVCHMETPLAPAGGPYEGYPTFSGPPQVVTALAETGYDACTTASNHTFDQGAAGVDRTLDTLDAAGLAHAGSARTPEESEQITHVEVPVTDGEPVDVALLSYTFGFNGIPAPNGETWRGHEIDPARILADAATARSEGADVVVAALHWGDEYVHEPNTLQSELAPQLIASPDIDLLLGHHAHVVQPIENVGGEWVVYGMGNLMANHAEPEGPKAEGLLTRFTFTESAGGAGAFTVTKAEFLPLYQTYTPPVEVLDVPAALASGDTGTATAARLQEALERTTEVVDSRGGAAAGLTMLESP